MAYNTGHIEIPNKTVWNSLTYQSGSGTYAYGDGATLKLTADLGSSGSEISGLNVLTIGSGTTFNGQRNQIYLSDNSFEGLLKLTGGTVKHVGVIASSSATCSQHSSWLTITNKTSGVVDEDGPYGTIEDSYVHCPEICQHAGGICGAYGGKSGNLTVQRCYVKNSGTSSDYAGGICGQYCGYGAYTVTINDCYYIGEIDRYGGGIVGSNACGGGGTTSGTVTVNISRCYAKGNLVGRYAGGIIGNSIGDLRGTNITKVLTITNCYTPSGTELERDGGGIIGSNCCKNTDNITVTVQRCYSDGYKCCSNAGGIVGSYLGTGSGTSRVININDCYFIGTVDTNEPSNTGGIVGYYSGSSSESPDININRCYAIPNKTGNSPEPNFSGDLVYGILATGADYSNTTITDCVSTSDSGTTAGGTSNNNSTTVSHLQGILYTQTNGASADWSTTYWIAGSGTNPPHLKEFTNSNWSNYDDYEDDASLDAFTSYPWDSDEYTAYSSEAEFLSGSGGGGDPHITPFIGNTYDLPHTEDTFLYFDNNDKYDRFIVKVKCWKLPKDYVNSVIERMRYNKLERVDRCQKILEHGTYFKYIKFEYNNQELIIDLDDLEFREYTNGYDLFQNSLPRIRKPEKNKYIGVSRIENSRKGLFTNVGFTNNTSTQQRLITVHTNEGTIIFRLAKDKRNVFTRNSIQMTFKYEIDYNNYKGIIIKQDKKNNDVDFDSDF